MNSTSSSAGSAGDIATVRLTVAQAVVKFLGQQYSERDGVKRKFFAGCFGIFGHGNVAGLGQALLQSELLTPGELPYHQGRNEQAMVHIAVGYARQLDRLLGAEVRCGDGTKVEVRLDAGKEPRFGATAQSTVGSAIDGRRAPFRRRLSNDGRAIRAGARRDRRNTLPMPRRRAHAIPAVARAAGCRRRRPAPARA